MRRIGFIGPINRIAALTRRGRLYHRIGGGVVSAFALFVINGIDLVFNALDRVVHTPTALQVVNNSPTNPVFNDSIDRVVHIA